MIPFATGLHARQANVPDIPEGVMPVSRRMAVGFLISSAALISPERVRAASWTVTDMQDIGDSAPGDGACDAGGGACTLRAAVQEANALPGDDVVSIPAGVYALAIAGAGEDAAGSGDLDILDSVELRGDGVLATTIDAAGLDRAIDVVFGNVTIADMTVRGGAVDGFGGGIRLQRGTSTLGSVTVSENRGSQGGGVAVIAGRVTMNDVRVTLNVGNVGGGIYNSGTVSMDACVVDQNNVGAVNATGGGIFTNGPLTLRACVLSGNGEDGQGGALQLSSADPVLIEDTVISGNRGHDGGGIYALNARLTIHRSLITGQRATGPGGGLWLGGSTILTMENSTISVNDAGSFGVEGGGGIYAPAGTLSMVNCTVVFNRGTPGGGIYLAGSRATLGRTIVANNTSSTVGNDFVGEITSTGFNLIEDPSPGSIVGDTATNLVAVDPVIDQLRDNGGPTQTHALLAGSPAIDAVGDISCLDGTGAPLTRDQRGIPRPDDGDRDGVARCDIGAFEVEFDCGPDADGDTVGDLCDCAPADPSALQLPPEADVRVGRDVAAGDALVTWAGLAPIAGSGTAYDVAADTIGALWSRRVADAPCVVLGLSALSWPDGRAIADIGWYYLVRGVNACGPVRGAGWGSDAQGSPRPTCP